MQKSHVSQTSQNHIKGEQKNRAIDCKLNVVAICISIPSDQSKRILIPNALKNAAPVCVSKPVPIYEPICHMVIIDSA